MDEEARIGESGFVGGRGHLLDVGDGLCVLGERVMGADQAFPCGDIAGIGVEICT